MFYVRFGVDDKVMKVEMVQTLVSEVDEYANSRIGREMKFDLKSVAFPCSATLVSEYTDE